MFLDENAETLDETRAARVQAAVDVLTDELGPLFAHDNMVIASRSLGFREDAAFQAGMRAIAPNRHAERLSWRLHTLLWAGRHALRAGGDFVECGVFRGMKSAFLMAALDLERAGRQFYLYDTFAGVPDRFRGPDTLSSAGHAVPGIADQVRARFASHAWVHVVEGTVPDTLGDPPDAIGYLHLDMNSAEAEFAALEVLWPRVSAHGVVVLDDYGWTAFQPQQVAAQAFFGARGVPILELPTGQAVVVKAP